MKHNTIFYSDSKGSAEYYIWYLSVSLWRKRFSTGNHHQNL